VAGVDGDILVDGEDEMNDLFKPHQCPRCFGLFKVGDRFWNDSGTVYHWLCWVNRSKERKGKERKGKETTSKETDAMWRTRSEQPEALRLADQLRDMSTKFKTPSHERGVCNGAIQKLRRLHAVNTELLEALKDIVEFWDSIVPTDAVNQMHINARAAIAKATGEQT